MKSLLSKKLIIPILLFGIIDVFLLAVLIYFSFKTFGVQTEYVSSLANIESIKSSVLLIKNNKKLLNKELKVYIDLLDNLIPDTESYFRVIDALEQLEKAHNVNVESYSINLQQTTEEKMSLELAIQGSKEDIESLIGSYQFISGRLITNDALNINLKESNSISFPISLYHKKYENVESEETVIISKEDIDFLDQILSEQ
ncbi:hypothetical protein COV58_00845 [Candidatus Roizmanbacteria bacterium CG11_big_fil_rev_8_21_14_0_20_36_8]|uniref:Uncharacterized protein n=2 Tax=Candidatus Roizmaniibacteriota TaxID=1752723 RepID=A0A2M6IUY5_9BACT|nr:MAG: hypothetical protein COV58_00845 [Candidatus Roizmanbacteria bacterium CG11_big_fil_rev_8_21_14_0_20_36_8]PIZ66043.1 MAG: hypothetical protein COY14_01185 [Candidatus Roizmanbacteria bacterium CG_4_10_14_0_2_um_filter_36_9]